MYSFLFLGIKKHLAVDCKVLKWDYPCACRENFGEKPLVSAVKGSPPRSRGKPRQKAARFLERLNSKHPDFHWDPAP